MPFSLIFFALLDILMTYVILCFIGYNQLIIFGLILKLSRWKNKESVFIFPWHHHT